MPDLWEIPSAAKIRCFGPSEALDRLEPPTGVDTARIAPDEVLWLSDPGRAGELEENATGQLASEGRRAAVVDHSDGWTLFSIVGAGGEQVLARLSSLRVPDEGSGFLQGQVAQVPGRVFCRPGRLDLLVGNDVAWFVRERLLHAGKAAGLEAADAPATTPVSDGARAAAS